MSYMTCGSRNWAVSDVSYVRVEGTCVEETPVELLVEVVVMVELVTVAGPLLEELEVEVVLEEPWVEVVLVAPPLKAK